MFVLENLCSGYYGGKCFLRDISLEIPGKSFTSIIGQNGSGKSTLLRTLAGLEKYSGHAGLGNYEIARISRGKFAKSVSVMLSGKNFTPSYPFTVREIISLGRLPHRKLFARLTEHDQEIILNAAKELHLEKFLDRNIMTLSDGERQLALLACALAQDTQIILLDEPTASLDPDKSLRIFALLRELANDGKCIIAAVHDINASLNYSDYYVALKNGKLISNGTAKNLSPEILREIYDTNFVKYVNSERNDVLWHAVC